MAVFYRQYRPQKFSDLVGQVPIVETLLSQLENNKFVHGYLFYGPRGTGKTSAARIFAKAVNCLKYGLKGVKKRNIKLGEPCNKCESCISISSSSNLDLIEIDAASNRGIDEIRELREKIKLSPVSSRFKVYIIDEAHMLTTEAFNALLKTLEEPPEHAIFILCTTEIGKLPPTIISRLQKFNFTRAKRNDLEKVISKIAESEKIKIDNEAAREIAQISDGSYRDAVSIFDQLAAKTKNVRLDDVNSIAKLGGWEQIYNFVLMLADRQLRNAVLTIEDLAAQGADISYFAKEVVLFLEKLLFFKINIESLADELNSEQVEKMRNLASRFESGDLQNLMKLFLIAETEIKIYPIAQIPLVLTVCKYIDDAGESNIEVLTRNKNSSGGKDEQAGKEEDVKTVVVNKTEAKSELEQQPEARSSEKASLKEIEKNWSKFISRVKPMNAHVMALLRSCRPIDFDGTKLTLEVFYKFHKEKLEEPKIIKILDDVMGETINKKVKFKFVLASQDRKPTSTVSKSDVVEISSEDLEKMTQEIFSE